jgi:ATP-dependent DNA helicase RecG
MNDTSPSAVAENHQLERTSLRIVSGNTADFAELARDCVCFVNGAGGELLIGIEDNDTHPPVNQRVALSLLDRCCRL